MTQAYRAILTLLFTLSFAAAPLITPPFQGFDGDQLPIPQDAPPIEPAGYAFSIWGLIYLWLIVSAVWGLARRATDPGWDAARPWLAASLALGTPWLWVALHSALWATGLIVAMAATAILAARAAPRADRWVLQAPVAIYAGWLTAASFVALGSTAAGYGLWPGAEGWAWLGLSAALATAAAVQTWLGKAPEYGLTVVWALIAVVVQNGLAPLSALAAAGALALAALALRAATRPATS